MTADEAKGYLRQIEKFSYCIEHKKTLLKELSNKILNIPSFQYSEDKVSGGGSGGTGFADDVVRKIELENEINADIIKFECLKNEITNKIHRLDKPIHINILFKRYVENKEFETIADETYYELGYIYNQHGKALQAFAEKMKICEEM